MFRKVLARAVLGLSVLIDASLVIAAEGEQTDLPLVFREDFENGADHWRPSDDQAWKVKQTDTDRGRVYSQFVKKSNFNPPHRSPFNISLLEGVTVGDFLLDAHVLSTHPDYGHRDAVIVFGYQDPAHFYYVHLGKKADDHANQIFIVNDAPRTKISLTSTDGTDWDDQWHHVRIRRRTKDGVIEIYFDDMDKPVMTAKDKHFQWGRIGVGTFDDTSDWDDIKLHGVKVDKP
ncbi:MAG: hypothetical protein RIC55_35570 [Pirellulaceae bacterium]